MSIYDLGEADYFDLEKVYFSNNFELNKKQENIEPEANSIADSYGDGQTRLRTETCIRPIIQKANAVPNELIDAVMRYENLLNAIEANDLVAVDLFLKAGSNPNQRNICKFKRPPFDHRMLKNDGMSPLDAVAKSGNIEIAKLLIKYGADPTALRSLQFIPDDDPNAIIGIMSPIYIAMLTKNYALLEMFVDYGADFNNVCWCSNPEDPHACRYKPLQAALVIKDRRSIEILLRGGAKP